MMGKRNQEEVDDEAANQVGKKPIIILTHISPAPSDQDAKDDDGAANSSNTRADSDSDRESDNSNEGSDRDAESEGDRMRLHGGYRTRRQQMTWKFLRAIEWPRPRLEREQQMYKLQFHLICLLQLQVLQL